MHNLPKVSKNVLRKTQFTRWMDDCLFVLWWSWLGFNGILST